MSRSSLDKLHRRRPPTLKAKLASALAVGAGMAVLGYTLAAPLAGDTISNKARASYRDREGIARTQDSNEVYTRIQQVGAFTLEEDRIKSGGPGQPVEALHTLTNTGNGRTTFNITLAEAAGAPDFDSVAIYAADASNAADYQQLLCATPVIGTAPDCAVGIQGYPVDPGAANAFTFVAVYKLPNNSGTDPAWTSGNTATVTATATTAGITYTTATTQTDTDTINVTNAAVFNVRKSIQVPSIPGPNGDPWPAAITSGPRSLAGCPTQWTAGGLSAAGCTYTVFRVDYNNNGGAPGDVSLRDLIPSGMTYVEDSAVWSLQSGTVLDELPGGDPAGIEFEYDTPTTEVRATFSGVTNSDSGALYFVVLINPTAQVGMATTTNVIDYSSEHCADRSPASTCIKSKTPPVLFEVLATPGVVAANQSSTVDDVANGGAEDLPVKSGIDLVVVPSAPVGGPVQFRAFVTNTGNDVDTFDITIDELAGAAQFPAGTTWSVFRSDGVSPLIDSSDNGSTIDTGPVAVGDTVEIMVVADIPNSAPIGTPASPYEVLVTARSSNDTSGVDSNDDSVWFQLASLSSSLVDLTNSDVGTPDSAPGTDDGDIGPGPSVLPTTTETVTRGTTVTFPLFIANNDIGFDNTFALAASRTRTFPGTVPTGWTVTFHAAGGACGVNPISSIFVAAGTHAEVLACVGVRDTALLGTSNLFFQAQSTGPTSTGAVISDIKLDAVQVDEAARPEITFEPDRVGELQEGGSVDFSHTLRNSGNRTCGDFTLSHTPLPSGWTLTVFHDVDQNQKLDTSLGDVQLDLNNPIPQLTANGTANDKFMIIAHVIAPLGAKVGDEALYVITATDNSSQCGDDTVEDRATVVQGQLDVFKTQVLDTACDGGETAFDVVDLLAAPGQCIRYRVVARNRSADPVTNVTINDTIHQDVNFENAEQPDGALGSLPSCQGSSAPAFSGSATASKLGAAKASSVSCGGVNRLLPNGSVTMEFSVQINP